MVNIIGRIFLWLIGIVVGIFVFGLLGIFFYGLYFGLGLFL